MDASSVSQLLNGKRRASRKVIEKICDRIGADGEQKQLFAKIASDRRRGTADPLSYSLSTKYSFLTKDQFSVISEWYHYAILELTFVQNFKSSASWIARSLGITTAVAQAAIERLEGLGLLTREKGRLVKTKKFITNFEPGMTSSALKNLQKQVIQMSADAIEMIPQGEKDITSMTMAIDVNKIDEARKLIAKFRRDLSQFMEDGPQSRVFHLGIQLYPVSKVLKGDTL
jgi:uncharacterized protein (TIGR02147 family)